VSIQTTTTFQMKKIHHGELYKFNWQISDVK
jgi:hypothetical protein